MYTVHVNVQRTFTCVQYMYMHIFSCSLKMAVFSDVVEDSEEAVSLNQNLLVWLILGRNQRKLVKEKVLNFMKNLPFKHHSTNFSSRDRTKFTCSCDMNVHAPCLEHLQWHSVGDGEVSSNPKQNYKKKEILRNR